MAFSVGAWLKATGYSQYEPNFRKHGYTSYHTVKELSRVDLEAAGVKDYGITRLASDVDYLKAVSEDEANPEAISECFSVHVVDHCVFVKWGTIMKPAARVPHQHITRKCNTFLDIFCLCTKTDHKPTNCILWLLQKLWNFKDCLTVL